MRQRTLGTAVLSMIVLATAVSLASADDTVIIEGPHYRHASTAAEGFFHGIGYGIRSLGLAAKLQSEAAINWERADALAIQNRESCATTFWDLRRINEQQRAIERGPRLTRENYDRMAAMDKPRLLNGSELDPAIGQLAWPAALHSPEFDEQRQSLDRLLACWAARGVLDHNEQSRVRQTTNVMLGQLKGHIRSLPPMEYMAAMRFLERMAYGATQPAQQFKGPVLAKVAGR